MTANEVYRGDKDCKKKFTEVIMTAKKLYRGDNDCKKVCRGDNDCKQSLQR